MRERLTAARPREGSARAAALGRVQLMLALCFPGANRTNTATRHLCAQVLAAPALRSMAVRMGLDKLRESGNAALSAERLRFLLTRCVDQLQLAIHATDPNRYDALEASVAAAEAILRQDQRARGRRRRRRRHAAVAGAAKLGRRAGVGVRGCRRRQQRGCRRALGAPRLAERRRRS